MLFNINDTSLIKIIIAGGRDFQNYELLVKNCNQIIEFLAKSNKVEIVSGCARGADNLGIKYAIEKGITTSLFPANWNEHGKTAGFIRNKEMANHANALILFWDGKSKGSRHMLDTMQKLNKPVYIIKY